MVTNKKDVGKMGRCWIHLLLLCEWEGDRCSYYEILFNLPRTMNMKIQRIYQTHRVDWRLYEKIIYEKVGEASARETFYFLSHIELTSNLFLRLNEGVPKL